MFISGSVEAGLVGCGGGGVVGGDGGVEFEDVDLCGVGFVGVLDLDRVVIGCCETVVVLRIPIGGALFAV